MLKDHVTKREPNSNDNYHFFGMNDNISKRVHAGLDRSVPKGKYHDNLLSDACAENKELVTLSKVIPKAESHRKICASFGRGVVG